ncbi:MAG: winged helix-turn-helix transcriptional regulator [Maritimibacter sp.]|uniref:MarR family winged helix-turn-helix transcriptional regulator n=1 Tax=Maritimibacter sp. TaxID=2003363 RepID=UPI001D43AE75|nr:MarR family winged helix-turn-helix transcriptional regulator [Maritimibacter sp.]MBL6428952.1 winged helix-turn-helix transcriptional regulator [Maritimibacter sp.]
MSDLQAVRELRPDELAIPPRRDEGDVVMAEMLSVRLSWLNDAVEHQTNKILHKVAGLNMLEWRCLLTLCTRGPKTGKEIASACNISPPQASRGLRSLGAKGLVEWSGGSDKRYFGPATVTDEGWRIYHRISPISQRRNEWLLSDLTDEDRDTLFRLLAIVRKRVDDGTHIDHLIENTAENPAE